MDSQATSNHACTSPMREALASSCPLLTLSVLLHSLILGMVTCIFRFIPRRRTTPRACSPGFPSTFHCDSPCRCMKGIPSLPRCGVTRRPQRCGTSGPWLPVTWGVLFITQTGDPTGSACECECEQLAGVRF